MDHPVSPAQVSSCLTITAAVCRHSQAVSDTSGTLVRLRVGSKVRILKRVLAALAPCDADTA